MFWNFFCEGWLLFCFSDSAWKMISTVNVHTTLFPREEVSDNICNIFSRQMYNWKLPHVNPPLNVWGVATWQHTIFTELVDTTLWSTKSGKIAVFLKIQLCENKRTRTLVRTTSVFSNIFVWATKRRTTEGSWHLHSVYPIWAAIIPTTVLTLIETGDA